MMDVIYPPHAGVEWKKYFYVNIYYKAFDASVWTLMDSGFLGPVTLMPMNYK